MNGNQEYIKLKNDIWIGNQITQEEIQSWGSDRIVTIEAGTGAGKSHFIKNNLYAKAMVESKKILFLVHRTNCFKQFEGDIKGKEDIITLQTYQCIDEIYLKGMSFDFSKYDYIVCDEFHYFTADARFNNKTDLSLEAILAETNKTRIFMSATANLMTNYLKGIKKLDLISYKADLNFDFIGKLHFYKNQSTEEAIIEKIIQNDEKAIVFVNKLSRLEKLFLKYKDISLFNCAKDAKQYKYVDKDKIANMLEDEEFKEQLLFTTSAMDTGVSIEDKQVKHIICNNILDVNVLVQCLGRKRMKNQNDKTNVYIKDVDNMKLNGHIKIINDKLEPVRYLEKNGQEQYTQEYGRKNENKEVLYDAYDENGNKIVVRNDMSYFKLLEDRKNYTDMMNSKYKTYISELLNTEYIDIDIEIEKESLTDYLDEIVGEKLYKEEQNELIDIIDLRVNGRQQRSYSKLNEGLEMISLPYIILPKKSNNKRYWIVEKIYL